MQQKHLLTLISIATLTALTSVAVAQFAPPSATAPAQNVLASLNIGDGLQTRNAPLVIASSDSAPYTNASITTDKGFAVKIPSQITSNPIWSPIVGLALDTNAPLSVNGIESAGDIGVSKSTTVGSTIVTAFARSLGISQTHNQPLCIESATGKVVICTDSTAVVMPTVPQAQISVSPITIAPGTATPITVTWSGTDAEHCYPVGGYSFATAGVLSGSTSSRAIVLNNSKKTAEFGIICTDSAGNSDIAQATVSSYPDFVLTNVGPLQRIELDYGCDPSNGDADAICRNPVRPAPVDITYSVSGAVRCDYYDEPTISSSNSRLTFKLGEYVSGVSGFPFSGQVTLPLSVRSQDSPLRMLVAQNTIKIKCTGYSGEVKTVIYNVRTDIGL